MERQLRVHKVKMKEKEHLKVCCSRKILNKSKFEITTIAPEYWSICKNSNTFLVIQVTSYLFQCGQLPEYLLGVNNRWCPHGTLSPLLHRQKSIFSRLLERWPLQQGRRQMLPCILMCNTLEKGVCRPWRSSVLFPFSSLSQQMLSLILYTNIMK